MELSRINLNLLTALHQLLRCRSVSQAARALFVTQPAMSRNLAQLRVLLGDPLLIRVGNSMQLTPRAEVLSTQIASLLLNIENLLMPEHFDPTLYRGRFNIAITDYTSEHILPALIEELCRTAPGLQLHFHLWEPAMITDLREGRMDLAACILDERPDDIHGHQVGEDTFSCLLRDGHPLLRQGGPDLQQYTQADHISISGGGDKNRALDSALAVLGQPRRVRITVPFIHSALAFCASSDCILTLPTHMAFNLRERHSLALRPLPFDVERVRYALIWHQRQQHDAAHTFVRDRFFDALEKSRFSKPSPGHNSEL